MAGRSLFSGDGVQSSRSMRPTNRSRRLPEAAAGRRPEMRHAAAGEFALLFCAIAQKIQADQSESKWRPEQESNLRPPA